MSDEDERFLQHLLATFRVEAEEHLGAMSASLLALERVPPGGDAATLVETLFREAHSLKGAARSVNLPDVERVCQSLERVLAALKRQQLAPSRELADTLHATLDGLGRLLATQGGSGAAPDPEGALALAHALDAWLAGPREASAPAQAAVPVPEAAAAPAPAPAAADTVRVAIAKLEALMTQAEELDTAKFGIAHVAVGLRAVTQAVVGWKREKDKATRLARAMRRFAARPAPAAPDDPDELFARTLLERLAELERAVEGERRGFTQRLDRLQADMRQVLMLPFASVLTALPKLARDLAQASGKEVELVLTGATLDADRRVLERLKTPLNHLVRNAIDHGIETPLVRERAGKPRRGRLAIAVAPREGGRIEMIVSDDGAGIALAAVRERAARMGLLDEATGDVPPQRIAELVFASGLSTRPAVNELSGHGLGLAIVREKIEALGGTIALEPTAGGVGTAFRILLPATLATYRGLVVMADGRCFVLPSRHVERVGRVPADAIHRAPSGDTVAWNGGAPLPLADLAALLELPPRTVPPPERAHRPLVIVHAGERRVALAVDEVIGDQEVLVKPLVPPLRRVRHVAGATLLGEGRVVPLLDAGDLVKTALRRAERRPAPYSSDEGLS